MLFARWIVSVLLVAAAVSFALYAGTGQMRFRLVGLRIVKWTVIAGLGFFAVLILERLALAV